MNPILVALTLIMSTGAIACAVIGSAVWRRRTEKWAAPFAIMLMLLVVWMLGQAFSLNSTGYDAKLFWLNMQYFGVTLVPVALFSFALNYTNQESRLSKFPALGVFLIVPIATIVMVWTNLGQLLRTDMILHTESVVPWLQWVTGPWFWIHTVHSYLLILGGTVLIGLDAFRHRSTLKQTQAIVLCLSFAPPILTNLLVLSGRLNFVDLTPVALSISALMVGSALSRFRLFDFEPVARRILTEKMVDAMLVLDLDNLIIDYNSAALNILNTTPDEILSAPIKDVLGDSNFALLNEMEPIESTGQFEVEFPSSGIIRHFDINASHLHDRYGRLYGRLILFRDMTERQKLLRLREDLVRAMVHDLRNPISNAYSAVQILSEDIGDELEAEDQKLLHQAEQTLFHSIELIGSILELNRLESGELPIKRELLPLTELIYDVTQSQESLCQHKNILLTTDLALKLPGVIADRSAIERVLQNLLDNAIKFTPRGGQITVRAYVPTKTGMGGDTNQVFIEVRDSGNGIPTSILDRLFEKFVKGDQFESGSGLGLAYCRMIIEAHKQEISILESTAAGTTIRFTLESSPQAPRLSDTAILKPFPSLND